MIEDLFEDETRKYQMSETCVGQTPQHEIQSFEKSERERESRNIKK